MAQFTWLGGSLSDMSSWSQPDSMNPVEPGSSDHIILSMNGTLTGSVGPSFADFSAVFDLEGSIVSVGSLIVDSGSVTIEAGATFSGGSELLGSAATAVSIVQKGGTSKTGLMEFNQGTYELDGGTLSVGGPYGEYIGDAGKGVTAAFTQKGGTNTVALFMELGYGATGTYNLSGGNVAAQQEYIGQNGIGTFTQTGGTNTLSDRIVLGIDQNGGVPQFGNGTYTLGGSGDLNVQTIFIGSDTSCTGTFNYDMNVADTAGLTITGKGGYPGLIVGGQGTGTFNQGAGEGTVNTTVAVGYRSTGVGTYLLDTGHLTSTDEEIGVAGMGTLNQIGGLNTVTGTGLIVGSMAGSTGDYELKSGTLKASSETIGSNGTGMLTETLGTNQVTMGDLTLGDGSGSEGTYTLSGGSLTSMQGDEVIGDAGNGTFTQTDGTNTIADGSLFIGNSNDGAGSYSLGKTGMLKITSGDLEIAVGGDSTGMFDFNTQAGDKATLSIDTKLITVGVHGKGTFIQGGGTIAAKLVVGGQVGSTGTYELDAGTVSAKGQVVGNEGAGNFTMNGGTDKISGGDLILGAFAAGGGTFNLKKGNLSDAGELVGYEGAGHFNQIAGTNKITGAGSLLDVGVMKGAIGTFTLAGGALTAAEEVIGDTGTGTFTQSGKGANTISGKGSKLDIGGHAGGNGIYTLTAGTLKSLVELVGDGGRGSVVQKNGTNTISGAGAKLDIGVQMTGNGTYELDKGTLTTPAETIGDAGTGSLTQRGGTNAVSGKLTVGNKGVGTVNITGGTVTVKGSTTLGVVAKSSGTVSVAHAKLTTPSLAIGTKGRGHVVAGLAGVIAVARTVTMSPGSTLTATAGSVEIGSGLKVAAGKIQIGKGGSLTGAGTVTGALVETSGSVQAKGGVLTIAGAVAGGGTLTIADHATLDLGGSDANTVAFAGKAGILKLEKAASVTGMITKLQIGDIIDIAGSVITAATLSGSTLTLTQKSGSPIKLNVAGTFTGTKFTVQDDGHGGSDIVLQSASALSPQVALFGQYVAAGFHNSSAGDAADFKPPPASHLDLASSHA